VDQLVGDLVDLVVLYTSTPRHFVSVLVLQEQYMSVGGNSDDVCVEVRSLRVGERSTKHACPPPKGCLWGAIGTQEGCNTPGPVASSKIACHDMYRRDGRRHQARRRVKVQWVARVAKSSVNKSLCGCAVSH
jgi:hypothetical protein